MSNCIYCKTGDHIELSGELHNMASMMPGISANNERMSSKLNINSKRVEFNDFMGLFKNKVKERKENETNGKHPLKSIIRDVYDKYHPELSINLDEFIFNKLSNAPAIEESSVSSAFVLLLIANFPLEKPFQPFSF